MRNPNSYLINNEILSLDYLSTFLPIKCHHQIISKGAVGGLTMSLINGDKWDNILKQEENIFKASSIARVAFVVKLAKVIKLLQINRFCHGDLHLSNVLITLNHCDRVHP
jgi:tRNA A-37 threonylcarbamoyl transferase component Bud32